MQQQVHEQRYLVAKQHIGAVEGAAGTCQVVGIYSSTEGSNTERWQTLINHKLKKKKKNTPQGRLLLLLQFVKETLLVGCKCLAVGTDKTICSHQETKHTLLYLWFLKGAVCLHKSKAYLADSASKEADLRNKTLISATYAETPLATATFRGAERNLSPILAEMVQHFRWRDKTTPLSSSSQPPGSPRQQRPVLRQSACLCIMSALKQAPEKINASDNWPIVLLWLLLPLAPVSSVNIFWQLYILAIGGMACPICSLEERNLPLQCLK